MELEPWRFCLTCLSSPRLRPVSSQLATEIISLQWKDSALLAEVIKISWNSWVKAVSSGGGEEVRHLWFQLLASLHNSASEPGDEIAGDIEKPSLGNTW